MRSSIVISALSSFSAVSYRISRWPKARRTLLRELRLKADSWKAGSRELRETLIVCHELTLWQAVTARRMVYLQSLVALTDATSQSRYEDSGRALSRGRARW